MSRVSTNIQSDDPIRNSFRGLIDLTGIDLENAEQIVIHTINPYLGDNIALTYGQIGYLHQRYPKTIIRVLSPNSWILKESSWLKPETIAKIDTDIPNLGSTFEAHPERFRDPILNSLNRYQGPKTVVFWDSAYIFQYAELFHKSGVNWGKVLNEFDGPIDAAIEKISARGTETLSLSYFGTNTPWIQYTSMDRPDKKYYGDLLRDSKSVRHFDFDPKILRPETHPIYDTAASLHQALFGVDAYLSWDPELYYDLSADQRPILEWMKASFSNPQAPYLIVNFNTTGQIKVMDLKEDYVRRLDELISQLKARYPQTNIAITQPESQFGEETTKESLKVIDRYNASSRSVAWLPENKELWKPLLMKASAVITQDSGFAHVANIFNHHVAIFGRDVWRKRDTPVKLWTGETIEYDALYVNEASRWSKAGNLWVRLATKDFNGPSMPEGLYTWLNENVKLSGQACGALLKPHP